MNGFIPIQIPSPRDVAQVAQHAPALRAPKLAVYAALKLVTECGIEPAEVIDVCWSEVEDISCGQAPAYQITRLGLDDRPRVISLSNRLRDELSLGLLIASRGFIIPWDVDRKRQQTLDQLEKWLRAC